MQLRELISADEIATIVQKLGAEISKNYEGKELLVIGVLKGSFMFFADLVREITCPMETDFVRLASYGAGITSSGNVVMTKDLEISVEGRHVLVVEDIIDTGHTTRFFLDLLIHRHPASLQVCALLAKKGTKKKEIEVNYVGREIDDRFVIGYGLDWNEKFRNLPNICYVEREPE